MIFVVEGEEMIEGVLLAVEGEAKMPDVPGLAFLQHEIHHPVVHISVLECLDASASDSVQEIIVEIVGPELLHRVMVNLQRSLPRPDIEIRHLRRNVICITGIAAQGRACRSLRLALEIGR